MKTALARGVHVLLSAALLTVFLLSIADFARSVLPFATSFVLAPMIGFLSIYPLDRPWRFLSFLDSYAALSLLGLSALYWTEVTAVGLSWLIGCGALSVIGAFLAIRQIRSTG